MSLSDPFKVEATASPPSQDDTDTPKCGILLPVPPDAPARTKPQKCGAEAPFKIRVKDQVSDAEVTVCALHKAQHDERAASLRTRGRATRTFPRAG